MTTKKWVKEDAAALSGLLEKLVDGDEFEQARAVARRLAELVPDDPLVWFLYGVAEARAGDPKAAERFLARSLELGGDELAASAQIAISLRLQGELEEALAWCRRALELDPSDANLHQLLALIHIQGGEREKAIEVLERLLRMRALQPTDEKEARRELGDLYRGLGRYDEALAHLRAILEEDKSDAAAWANVGRCLARKEDRKGALEAFEKAARIEPDPQNLYNLGDAHMALGESEKAVEHLRAAVRRDPDHNLAHYDLSLAYVNLGRFAEGAAAARAALKDETEMSEAQFNLGLNAMTNLGVCLLNLEKYEEAVECLRRNEKLFAGTYFNLGLIHFRTDRHKEALVYFKKVLEIEPTNAETLCLVGQTYDALGNWAAAEKSLRRSLELDPRDARTYYDLGNLLLKIKDRRKEARKLFEKSIELDPGYEWPYYCLACWYALEGMKNKAFEWLEKALQKGLRKRKWIEADKDLDSLKGDARFAKLMRKYFAEEGA